jgi:hypothetical protein
MEEDGDPRDEIERLEARIEQLEAKLESCRKFGLASQLAVVLGGIVLLAIMIGAIRFNAAIMATAIVAVLGGIVLSGSNRSTANEAKDQLADADARRAELIGLIQPRIVSDTVH